MKKIVLLCLSVCLFFGCFSCLISCAKTEEMGTRYEITAEYSPQNGMLAGTVKVLYEHLIESETDLLKFQLYANAYRQDSLYSPISNDQENTAFYQGESYGEIVVSSVNGAKNWEVMGEDENIL